LFTTRACGTGQGKVRDNNKEDEHDYQDDACAKKKTEDGVKTDKGQKRQKETWNGQ